MVERYKQGQLASPVVGTPGLDKSAGQGALAIAQASDAMNQRLGALALQAGQQQQQNFQQAAAAFHQYGAQKNYEARIQKAQDMENRRQQIQFDRLDEDNNLSNYLTDLQTKHADNPTQALDQFKTDLPLLQQQFQDRYSNDPIKLRMLMPSQRSAMMQAQSGLKQWATQTTTNNLNRRLALMPEDTTQKIGGLSGSLEDQLKGYKSIMAGQNSIYEDLKNKALTPDVRDQIATKQMSLNNDAAKSFVNNALAKLPDGEDGVHYLDTMRTALKNPRAFGLDLHPDDHVQLVAKVNAEHTAQQQVVITGIRDNAALETLDVNKYKQRLLLSGGDPKQMTSILGEVQDKVDELNKRVALVSKEPDSPVKLAKLTGLKQTQSTLINEIGLEVKQERQHQQDQRQNIMFQHHMEAWAQRAVQQQRNDMRFNQWVADVAARGVKNEADKIKLDNVDKFSSYWGTLQKDITAAYQIKAGPDRQKAMHSIVDKAIPVLNDALHNGAITGDTYGSHLNSLQKDMETVAGTTTTKPAEFLGMRFGNETTKVLPQKDKAKAEAQAQAEFGAIVAAKQANFAHMEDARTQLGALTTSKAEKVILNQYINQKLPLMLNSKTFQSKSPQEQQRDLAKAVRESVTLFRQGKLK
ncbi:MAG: hypothetical protein JST01_14480 [Cyanobacteria bacterium SZAS TMP-1]|nr:hypothetical protein [Cyanobacteria bacterium SZAS TMP-1]